MQIRVGRVLRWKQEARERVSNLDVGYTFPLLPSSVFCAASRVFCFGVDRGLEQLAFNTDVVGSVMAENVGTEDCWYAVTFKYWLVFKYIVTVILSIDICFLLLYL